jgi:hypothetical protein
MSYILEILAELVLTPGASKDDAIVRVFVVITMTVAGVCFAGFAAFVLIAARPLLGIPVALLFIALSLLCFWLVRRAKRSSSREITK